MRAIRTLLSSLALPLLLPACLPDDTRAPPGQLVVTVSADPALSDGIAATADGWSISYRRFLVVLGDVKLDGDDCEPYTESDYSRIFELTGASPQKVMLGYALGSCSIGFRIASPAWDTLLGTGVSEQDDALLRTPGSDAHASDGGVSVHIEGTAERLGVQKTFNWSFRRFIEYVDCRLTPGDDTENGNVRLVANETKTIDILIRGGALFQNPPIEPAVSPSFEAFRAADDEHGDANGEITLEELQNSPVPLDAIPRPLIQSLGDRVYLQLLPQIAHLGATGVCHVRSSEKRPEFGH
ncbi:MAG TPA: hypothetical protein VG937_21905 [Polyangiaceae bacterium]|nr:hypothetical protein [Polyangiaceae bacterium]